MTTLGSYSFSNNPSLTTFYLGPNVSTINEYAFSFCTHLNNFVIPEGSSLHVVQGHSFEGCDSLISLNVLDKTSLVFRYNALMSLDLSRLIVYLPTSKLFTFVVPSPVASIEDYTFQGCERLHEIIISDGIIRNIGFKAFDGCINLERLVFPDTIVDIGDFAFNGCIHLVCGSITGGRPNKDRLITCGIKSSAFATTCPEFFANLNRGTCKVNINTFTFKFTLLFPFLFM